MCSVCLGVCDGVPAAGSLSMGPTLSGQCAFPAPRQNSLGELVKMWAVRFPGPAPSSGNQVTLVST